MPHRDFDRQRNVFKVVANGLDGTEISGCWLKSMISHHQGAIAMADVEIKDGANPEMITLAKNIVSAQQSEIDQMNTILAGVGQQGG